MFDRKIRCNHMSSEVIDESKIMQEINVPLLPEEKEAFDRIFSKIEDNKSKGKPVTYSLSRDDMLVYAKVTTFFENVADIFIKEQQSRGNSISTIEHYKYSIKRMKLFFCWLTNKEEYEYMNQDDAIKAGGRLPILIFENDGIIAEYRQFLSVMCECGSRTIEGYLIDFRSIAYWLMENSLIKRYSISIKHVETDLKEVYTDAEIELLLAPPAKDCSFIEYRNWVVVNWCLATGNRVSTIVNIKIDDLDLLDCSVNINTQKNKHKKVIKYDIAMRRILQKYLVDCLINTDGSYKTEYLFPSADGGIITRSSMGRSIAEYNTSRGVKKTSMHLFRHTFAKRWILSGGGLVELRIMLGHSSMDMVNHYANIYGKEIGYSVEEHSVHAMLAKRKKGTRIQVNRKR